MAWWKQTPQRTLPDYPINYPPGVFVGTKHYVYYIGKDKVRNRVFSNRVLDSWGVDVIEGTEESLIDFREGPVLGFRNGTLIRDISNSQIYLISENKRRHVVNPDWVEIVGIDLSKAMVVSKDEVELHPEGEVLS